MKKKFVKKFNKNEIVIAEQIQEELKKVMLKEFTEYKEITANRGDWIVTESNGNQCIFSEKSFPLYYEPYKELLLD